MYTEAMGATVKATKRYFENRPNPEVPPARLGRTGWAVSPIGFGGYRVHDQNLTHREALRHALASGCNLIDTSTNYTDGGSERLIGQVLEEQFVKGALSREQVVVVTKAGYVQGENLRLARERAASGRPFPEMVEYHEQCWHCLHPEFLEDQLTHSLDRLKLSQVDVLLLHNPEYFLKTNPDHAEYYRRIKQAFEYLEKEVKRGRIQYYGISSNTFGEPKDSPEYTSMEAVMELAREVSPDHHFAVVQFPFNLLEAGAALELNNSGLSVTQFAATHDLGTLVNRPLNAFDGNQMVRLADFPSHTGRNVAEEFRQALRKTVELEGRYPAKKAIPIQQVAWGHILNSNMEKIPDIESWKQILSYEILPTLDEALSLLSENEDWQAWTLEYRETSSKMFDALTRYFEWRAAQQSAQIAAKLDRAAPALRSSPTLSQKAIRVYRSIPGINCVLVGMRRPEYVRDSLSLEPVLDAQEALDALRACAKASV